MSDWPDYPSGALPGGAKDATLWRWFQTVSRELEATRERNAQLSDRVAELEDQLSGRITDQQLLNELPRRAAHVLQAANDAAEEIGRRALQRARVTMEHAREEAAGLHQNAVSEARAVVAEGRAKGAEYVGDARRRAQYLLESAAQERAAVLTEVAALEDEVRQLLAHLMTLRQANSELARVLDDTLARWGVEPRRGVRAAPVAVTLDDALPRSRAVALPDRAMVGRSDESSALSRPNRSSRGRTEDHAPPRLPGA